MFLKYCTNHVAHIFAPVKGNLTLLLLFSMQFMQRKFQKKNLLVTSTDFLTEISIITWFEEFITKVSSWLTGKKMFHGLKETDFLNRLPCFFKFYPCYKIFSRGELNIPLVLCISHKKIHNWNLSKPQWRLS